MSIPWEIELEKCGTRKLCKGETERKVACRRKMGDLKKRVINGKDRNGDRNRQRDNGK